MRVAASLAISDNAFSRWKCRDFRWSDSGAAKVRTWADPLQVSFGLQSRLTFGLGIHRCIGSNLARMEMRIAVEEWLKRIPYFRLDPSRPMTWSQGTVRGPRLLPIMFG